MKRYLKVLAIALLCQAGGVALGVAPGAPAASEAQKALKAAAAEQKYTFLVFYKDKGPALQTMAQTVKRGVDSRSDRATFAYVDVANPDEKELVARFDVSRAPLPLTVAVAPNGAMTSLTPKTISDEQMEKAFVTPVMAQSMKSMQEGKFVFICIQSTAKSTIPAGVRDFCNDPEYKGRAAVVGLPAADPAEAELVRQLESDVAVKGSTTVFLAPPGVLVGKFTTNVTKAQLATALHKAGKCCDDPNCKHGAGAAKGSPSATVPAKQTPTTRKK